MNTFKEGQNYSGVACAVKNSMFVLSLMHEVEISSPHLRCWDDKKQFYEFSELAEFMNLFKKDYITICENVPYLRTHFW